MLCCIIRIVMTIGMFIIITIIITSIIIVIVAAAPGLPEDAAARGARGGLSREGA